MDIGEWVAGEVRRHYWQENDNCARTVLAFDDSCPEGAVARKLYADAGLVEVEKAGPNPAGVPTVILRRRAAGEVTEGVSWSVLV